MCPAPGNRGALPWDIHAVLLLPPKDNFLEYLSFNCFSYLEKPQLQDRAALMPYPYLKKEKENASSVSEGVEPLPLLSLPF